MKKSGTPAKVRRKALGSNGSGVNAEADALDQGAPTVQLGLRALQLVGRGAAIRNQADHGQGVLHAFVFEGCIDRRVGCLHHIGRGFGGGVKAEPFFNCQFGEALLGERRYFRCECGTRFARDGQDAQFTATVIRQKVAVRREHGSDLPAYEVGNARHRAAVGHVLHGDAGSEQFLSEMFNPASYPARHISMEGIYEYGSRAGVWRILREFEQRGLPLTVFGVSMALERHPELVSALRQLGHEIACHGWRWIHYQNLDEATERDHMHKALAIIERLTGQRHGQSNTVHGAGWYTGRDSPNTRRLVVDHGGFAYDSDYYGDDLPFWMKVAKTNGQVVPHLVLPYTLDTNDMRFSSAQGFAQAEDFFIYLRDSFDALYAEGADSPKMMSVGMHCRLLGRPGRIVALQKFMDHIERHDRVWVCRRIDVAQHWRKVHPYQETP